MKETSWQERFDEKWFLHNKLSTPLAGFEYPEVGEEVKAFITEVEAAAYERGKADYYSAIDVHKAIDALEPPEQPISLIGEDGKLFNRLIAKAMEAPFPEVALQYALQRVHEQGFQSALATVEEKVKESHLIVYLPLRDEVLSLINELKK